MENHLASGLSLKLQHDLFEIRKYSLVDSYERPGGHHFKT